MQENVSVLFKCVRVLTMGLQISLDVGSPV